MVTIEDGVEVYPYRPPRLLAPASLDQLAVQNQWYTLFSAELTTVGTTPIRNPLIVSIGYDVTIANETLEIELTVDGITQTVSHALTFGTPYWIMIDVGYSTNNFTWTSTAAEASHRAFLFMARSVLIRIRKTTAGGASRIQAKVVYGVFRP